MAAGTLTLTQNSTAVTGSGTAFTSDLSVGDIIFVALGGVNYTLVVSAIASNTSLTIARAFLGSTTSGVVWTAVPQAVLIGIHAQLAADTAWARRAAITDKITWQRVFSSSGQIEVPLPDGSSFTGPAWGGITAALDGITTALNNKAAKGTNSDITSLTGLTEALSITQGGTGGTTASGARTNLGLGDMATKTAGDGEGYGMLVGTLGIGRPSGVRITNETGTPALVAALSGYGLIPFRNEQNITNRIAASSPGLWIRTGGTFVFLSIPHVSSAPVRISGGLIANGTIDFTRTLYDDLNTTKASDGTLKAASPVARIVKSQEENQRKDVDEDGFNWCGCGTANAEAEGVSISRLDVGVYIISGSAGLSSSGWQLLPPMDPGGMGEMGIVEAEQKESGGLMISLFRRKYMLSEGGEMVKAKGEPIDVPPNSWIDVRLDMPANSIWNQGLLEVQKNMVQSVQENDADTRQLK